MFISIITWLIENVGVNGVFASVAGFIDEIVG